jgi:hypothetical protein
MTDTKSAQLAERYLALGGQRLSATDDNAVSTRLWESEPHEATDFWDREIASLPGAQRNEVELLLPSISGDGP